MPRHNIMHGNYCIRDSITANNVLADQFLPSAAISVDLMLNLFAAKGMTLEEVVPMLGKTKIFIT
jgi:hypothetical protein